MRGHPYRPWGNNMDRVNENYDPGPQVPPKHAQDYDSLDALAQDIARFAMKDGSFIVSVFADGGVNFDRVELDSGYMVGGVAGAVKSYDTWDKGNIAQYLNTAMSYVGARASDSVWADPKIPMYLGIWTDDETGFRYVELAEHVEDRDLALGLAKIRGEKAIYGWEEGHPIIL